VAELQSTETQDAVSYIGPVHLSVPADPAMSRIARLTASGVASLAGCTLEELQNVKIAVSEVLIILIERGDGNRIDLEFQIMPVCFRLTARCEIPNFEPDHPSLALCRAVLEDVSHDYSVDSTNGVAEISVELVLSGPD
jgi:hypothetical protein